MSRSLVLTAIVSALGLATGSMVSAEHWQDFGANQRMSVRIDLDALKIDGPIISYTVELTYPNDPRHTGRRDISTAEIDCSTGMRRHLTIATQGANGTMTSRSGDGQWRKIIPAGTPEDIRRRYCPH